MRCWRCSHANFQNAIDQFCRYILIFEFSNRTALLHNRPETLFLSHITADKTRENERNQRKEKKKEDGGKKLSDRLGCPGTWHGKNSKAILLNKAKPKPREFRVTTVIQQQQQLRVHDCPDPLIAFVSPSFLLDSIDIFFGEVFWIRAWWLHRCDTFWPFMINSKEWKARWCYWSALFQLFPPVCPVLLFDRHHSALSSTLLLNHDALLSLLLSSFSFLLSFSPPALPSSQLALCCCCSCIIPLSSSFPPAPSYTILQLSFPFLSFPSLNSLPVRPSLLPILSYTILSCPFLSLPSSHSHSSSSSSSPILSCRLVSSSPFLLFLCMALTLASNLRCCTRERALSPLFFVCLCLVLVFGFFTEYWMKCISLRDCEQGAER